MYHGYPMVMGRDVAFKASISSINPCKVSLISWTSLCSVASWSFCWWFSIQKNDKYMTCWVKLKALGIPSGSRWITVDLWFQQGFWSVENQQPGWWFGTWLYWEFHHPIWLSYFSVFFRGVGQPPTSNHHGLEFDFLGLCLQIKSTSNASGKSRKIISTMGFWGISGIPYFWMNYIPYFRMKYFLYQFIRHNCLMVISPLLWCYTVHTHTRWRYRYLWVSKGPYKMSSSCWNPHEFLMRISACSAWWYSFFMVQDGVP